MSSNYQLNNPASIPEILEEREKIIERIVQKIDSKPLEEKLKTMQLLENSDLKILKTLIPDYDK